MTKFKYTDEMVSKMKEVLSVAATAENIDRLAKEFEFSTRSVGAKARTLGFEVAPSSLGPVFNADETASFKEFVTNNSGSLTAEEIAAQFCGGKFSARQVSGKALSLELSKHIKAAEKKVTPKTYTAEEEATITQMVSNNAFLEEIAEKLGKPVNSVRGKLLSMKLVAKQKNKKPAKTGDYEGIEAIASSMTVAELAAKFEKTERGVKTVLTRHGISAKDYTPKAKD